MGLALAATMPSGVPRVAKARDELVSCLPPWQPKSVLGSTIAVAFSDVSRPWGSDFVYVGHGPNFCSPRMLASPWGNPFLSAEDAICRTDRFEEYLWSRADLQFFLAPLVGKTITCHR